MDKYRVVYGTDCYLLKLCPGCSGFEENRTIKTFNIKADAVHWCSLAKKELSRHEALLSYTPMPHFTFKVIKEKID